MKIKAVCMLLCIYFTLVITPNSNVSAIEYLTADTETEHQITIEREDNTKENLIDVFLNYDSAFQVLLIRGLPIFGWIIFSFGLLLFLFSKKDQSYRAWGLRLMTVLSTVLLFVYLAAHHVYSKYFWTSENIFLPNNNHEDIYIKAREQLMAFQINNNFLTIDATDLCRDFRILIPQSFILYAPLLAILSFFSGVVVIFFSHNGTRTKQWGFAGLMITLPLVLISASYFISRLI